MTRNERRRDAAILYESKVWRMVRDHNEETCKVCRERTLSGPTVMCSDALELYARWNAAKRRRMALEAQVMGDEVGNPTRAPKAGAR